jgi:hypothetical protein
MDQILTIAAAPAGAVPMVSGPATTDGPDAEYVSGYVGGEQITVTSPARPGATVAETIAGTPLAVPSASNAVITGPGFWNSVTPVGSIRMGNPSEGDWSYPVPPAVIAARVPGQVVSAS